MSILLKNNLAEPIKLDSSEKETSYLLITENNGYLKVSPTAYYLVKSVNEGLSFEEIAKPFKSNNDNVPTVEDVKRAYESIKEKIDLIDNRKEISPSGFWMRFQLFPEFLVNKISNRLTWLYHSTVRTGGVFFILLGIILSIYKGIFSNTSSSVYDPTAFWLGYLLFFISVVFHEFGHSTACTRNGAKPSSIGFTMYLVFPALYSDVTDAWKLKSRHRVLVGLGGVYFQMLLSSIYILIYSIWGGEHLKIAVLMIFAGCIMNINPFFKFDGYWIISDLLGVANLSQQPKRLLLHLYNKIVGRETKLLPWRTRTITILSIYSVLSLVIIGLFIYFFSQTFLTRIHDYPNTFLLFVNDLSTQGQLNWSKMHSIFISSVSLYISLVIIYKIFKGSVSSIISKCQEIIFKNESTIQKIQIPPVG